MAKQGSGVNVVTPIGTAYYAFVWEPRESLTKGKPAQYSIRLVFDRKTDLSKLKAAASTAARNKFGKRIPKNMESPFHSGDNTDDPALAGKTFINAKSKTRPGIVDANVDQITDETEFYSGCRCKISVYAFGYDTAGNQGVAFLLNNIQKTGDGKRLSGRKDARDEFDEEEVEDAEGYDADDPGEEEDAPAPRRAAKKTTRSRAAADDDDVFE
jgi:Protein of unknown function (DUF2815)